MDNIIAGLVFQKPVDEWFDVSNQSHRLAFYYYGENGCWPEDFLPSRVWNNPGWHENVSRKLTGFKDQKKEEFLRLHGLVRRIRFGNWWFRLKVGAGDYRLAAYHCRDEVRGAILDGTVDEGELLEIVRDIILGETRRDLDRTLRIADEVPAEPLEDFSVS